MLVILFLLVPIIGIFIISAMPRGRIILKKYSKIIASFWDNKYIPYIIAFLILCVLFYIDLAYIQAPIYCMDDTLYNKSFYGFSAHQMSIFVDNTISAINYYKGENLNDVVTFKQIAVNEKQYSTALNIMNHVLSNKYGEPGTLDHVAMSKSADGIWTVSNRLADIIRK